MTPVRQEIRACVKDLLARRIERTEGSCRAPGVGTPLQGVTHRPESDHATAAPTPPRPTPLDIAQGLRRATRHLHFLECLFLGERQETAIGRTQRRRSVFG